MTAAKVVKIRQMPKGGRKGGSVFPRTSFDTAIAYARRLVSKTHTGAQPQDVIFSGVVGAKGSRGVTHMSALRQYGFLKGDLKSNFSADDLAIKIAASPPEELVPRLSEFEGFMLHVSWPLLGEFVQVAGRRDPAFREHVAW
jgi:hypothetical protein